MKLANLAAGGNTKANIVVIGDSISMDLIYQTYATLNAAYGYGGIVGGPPNLALYPGLSSGSTRVYGDYSSWITGSYYNIPADQSLWFSAPPTGAATSEIRIDYLSDVGGGVFKVQTAPVVDGTIGSYTDLAGFTSVSTNGPAGEHSLTFPVSGTAEMVWRIVGLSGDVSIVSGGRTSDRGLVVNGVLSLGSESLEHYAAAPADMWTSFLDTAAPDLAIIMVKDEATPAFREALVTIQNHIHAANPLADTLFVGAYNSHADDPGFLPAPVYTMAAQNALIQDVVNDPSVPGSKVYWDAGAVVGTWTSAYARGWFSDGTHLSVLGQAALGDAWLQEFDLLPVPEPPPTILIGVAFGLFGVAARIRSRRLQKTVSH